jgi:hypothetical protein
MMLRLSMATIDSGTLRVMAAGGSRWERGLVSGEGLLHAAAAWIA